jgi:serine/threonine-protein kinase
VWVDRQGNETSIPAPLRAYDGPRLSPDGTRIAVTIRDQEFDIWIWNLAREEGLRRLTFHRAVDWHPVWTPDGGRVVYSSSREVVPNLFAQSADGTGTVERLTVSPVGQHPSSIGPSGAGVVGHEIPPTTAADIAWWLRSKTVSPSKPDVSLGANGSEDTPLVRTSAIEVNPDISPDGRYFAYQSNESGRHEIFVRPFPNANDGGIWQVSTGGGTRPVWARNGRELFYLDLANRLTAVPVRTAGSRFTFGNPVTVLERSYLVPPGDTRPYDVSADGQRFLMIKDGALSNPAGPPASIVVVLNWAEELKAKLPTGR